MSMPESHKGCLGDWRMFGCPKHATYVTHAAARLSLSTNHGLVITHAAVGSPFHL